MAGLSRAAGASRQDGRLGRDDGLDLSPDCRQVEEEHVSGRGRESRYEEDQSFSGPQVAPGTGTEGLRVNVLRAQLAIAWAAFERVESAPPFSRCWASLRPGPGDRTERGLK